MVGIRNHKIIRHIYTLFFTLLFLILLPTVLVLFIPVYIFRFLATNATKRFRPDLDKLVNTRSAVLATNNPHDKPRFNLCVWLTLEGNLHFDKFIENFHQNIVFKKLSNGKFANPEYQQYFEKWLGFLFWKWEENFNIKDHMRYYYSGSNSRSRLTTEEELTQIIKELTWKPFTVGKSPWEFLFIPNYLESSISEENNQNLKTSSVKEANKSILIFRVHHGFCDGFAVLQLLMKEVNNISMQNFARPSYPTRNIFSQLLYGFLFWIRGPYETMEMMVESNDTNDWHLPQERLQPPFNTAFTNRIPLEYIKGIKNSNRVSFTAVVLAAITGGLRSMMLETGVTVPEFMNTAIPMPMPGHPYKLRNHFIFSFLKLPIGISDSRNRLAKMERNIQKLKQSPVPLFSFALIPVIGGWFTCMMDFVSSNLFSTVLVSNFPGPLKESIFIGGGGSNRVVDMNFSAGLGVGNVGIGFCMMSYYNGMRIISTVGGNILSSDADVDRLNQKIVEELEILRNLEYV